VSPTLGALLADPASLLGVAGGSVLGIVGKPVTVDKGTSSGPEDDLKVPSFGVILKWLETSSAANILSTPHILTTDNEEATIEVGQKIPFRKGIALPNLGGLTGGSGINSSALSGLANFASNVERIDVSLKLTLTPHVNERRKVRLEIDQQVEDLVSVDEQSQTATTATRNTKTTVVVDDGQSVVIGGLMRDKTRDSESKIPFLGDLPLIGWLFKQRSHDIEKVNLLLVLTPYIIRDAGDFQRIFERKMGEYETFQASYYGHLPQYRAHIDYSRKQGPLAKLGARVAAELKKIENGGDGGGDLLITPSPAVPEAPVEPASPAEAEG
jgi:general secretion pathway protein D